MKTSPGCWRSSVGCALFCLTALMVVTVPARAATAVFTNDFLIAADDRNFDGSEIVVSNCMLTVDGPHTFSRLELTDAATLTHSSYPSGAAGLSLTITGDMLVRPGTAVDATGKGYPGGFGPGAGKPGPSGGGSSGGGYGGYGGRGTTNTASLVGAIYGLAAQPGDHGSGGGPGPSLVGALAPGGSGGGLVRLDVRGVLQIEGRISADGAHATNRLSGGGSGGGAWIRAGTLSGSGTISASGGRGEPGQGGGGGGGRVAIQCDENLFTGLLRARGGEGFQPGGPGSVYTRIGSRPGEIVFDNEGNRGLTVLPPDGDAVGLTLQGGAVLGIPVSRTVSRLTLKSGSSIVMTNQPLNVTGDAVVDENCAILADETGHGSNLGPGAGRYGNYVGLYTGGGGGHGGTGGRGGSVMYAEGGAYYGPVTGTAEPGSGGGSSGTDQGSSRGGGVVRLQISGTLVVNGWISAQGGDGTSTGSGGGAGGSVWIVADTISGGGVIAADGGSGNGFGPYAGGGGAGGRIVIESRLNLFFGAVSARGGSGYEWGGAGTILFDPRDQPYGTLLIDNGGPASQVTGWTGGTPPVDLLVRNGGMASVQQGPALNSLIVGAGGTLLVTNQPISVTRDVVVAAGGRITADGHGNRASSGPGRGIYDTYRQSGSGGGYGGIGGMPPGFTTAGGSYGDLLQPRDLGSGGGASSQLATGSQGGGAIQLTIGGTLQVDGVLSANGAAGGSVGDGGGSGGSVNLSVGTLAGSGIISANGGSANVGGGGGGGGRIAIAARENMFRGSLAARGGAGAARGGAGTICTQSTSYTTVPRQLVLDNGGEPGGITGGFFPLSQFDVVVSGGAVWVPIPTTQMTLAKLVVGSNSVMVVSNQSLLTAAMVEVLRGGAIVADGLGNSPLGVGGYQASGRGNEYICGGGGHGGFGGGPTVSKPVGGNAYDNSATNPTLPGSRGGGLPTGGAGGGVIRMNVTGVLNVDGVISANGIAGTNSNVGGGSGGAINLTVGTLAGSGVISASGGPGRGIGEVAGGGGGGGRIAIQYGTRTFGGSILACGAPGGGLPGGAGTIYLKANNESQGSLLVDNCGQAGTNTPLTVVSGIKLVVTGGARVQPTIQTFLGSLLVGSNAWVQSDASLVVAGDASILRGGGIVADGTGFRGGEGPGRGMYGGGGSYGGYGAPGQVPAPSGVAYGNPLTPMDRGSGGGGQMSAYGGSGGGIVRLDVRGTLSLEGIISACGSAGLAPGYGGGSGGSIWITAANLTGNGAIRADGGFGNGLGGGGAGGRVALVYNSATFDGAVSARGAFGGSGYAGAGTVYRNALNTSAVRELVIDNGGNFGTNTPVGNVGSVVDLVVRNGATCVSQPSGLLVRNLHIAAGGTLAWGETSSACDLVVLSNAVVEAEGRVVVDGRGYPIDSGTGHGLTTNSVGSGAGHGGSGGASAFLSGGEPYGSASEPMTVGSGGGRGLGGYPPVGGQGGGALIISVGNALILNGTLSANGVSAGLDDGGGGSGGSIWLNSKVFAGVGSVRADGGDGQMYLGGGGAGGRIAIYSPDNLFGGSVSAQGGEGFGRGSDGTVYESALPAAFGAMAHSPEGTVTRAVDQVTVTFNKAVAADSFAGAQVELLTPAGTVDPTNIVVQASPSPRGVLISFPAQMAEGVYKLTLGPQLRDFFGETQSEAYVAEFAIAWPMVSGAVADAENRPIPEVRLEANAGVTYGITDTNGEYALKLPVGVPVTLRPAKTGWFFVPAEFTFQPVTGDLANYNFTAHPGALLSATAERQGTNISLSWQGVNGLQYQPMWSSNLVDWIFWSGPVPGTNSPMTLLLPITAEPTGFYRIEVR